MPDRSDAQLLRVDLSSGRCRREPIPASLLQDCFGGRGLGVALLQEFGGVDPYDPAMPLVFTSGPLCPTQMPMTTRCVLTGRSPQTGTIVSCSSGGAVARRLRGAGLTALVLQGMAVAPSLLKIAPHSAELLPAKTLWGRGTGQTLQQLTQPGWAAAVIGPAGEQRIPYAGIITTTGEPFERAGFGAVMGAKNLKAITLAGDAGVAIADQTAFATAHNDLLRLFQASPFLLGPFGVREHGTSALVDLLAARGMLPGPNFMPFQGNSCAWNAAAMRSQTVAEPGGCFDCMVACKRLSTDGTELPGYDQLAAFGGLCGIDTPDQIVAICRQCRQLGLDPLSLAGTLAVWAELNDQTLDQQAVTTLLTSITSRSGQGAILAQGAVATAAALGDPGRAMAVKGLELAPYDLRASTGLALACAVSPHGNGLQTAWPLASEILRKPVPTDRFSFDGKARLVALLEDAAAAADLLPICRFSSAAVGVEELAALLAATIGQPVGAADLLAAGRRTLLRERAFNRSCGFSAVDDRLPDRFFTAAANGLPPLDRTCFQEELAAYQQIRGAQDL